MKVFDRIDAVPPLNGEEKLLVESVRTLAQDKLAPRAERYDATGEFPWDNIADINALDLNAMFIHLLWKAW